MALVHGRCAGVIGDTGDGDLEPAQSHDTLHHANLQASLFEQTALLDVEFDIAGNVARLLDHVAPPCCIAAHETNAFANGLAGARDLVEISVGDVTDGELAADSTTFLVLPYHHVKRMSQSYALFAQRAHHFNGGERADGSVEVAAVGHRVDM